jgi:hypothetical protein|tara:strand:+ start:958 stop:2445 length:1488 start_codon:yes stop_codon:yes gene_type:complete
MANTIKHKRGSGSNPSASDLAVGELAIRTDTGVVFTKKDDGTVAEIAGGGETNLGVSTTSTAVTVTSDTGNNATISEASSSAAGVMSAAHHDKLDGIESNATADQSASEILTAIKTVDGSGSGLDADTLDGVEGSSFLRSDAADTKTSGNLIFNDNVKALFGTGSDLEILHNGSHSFVVAGGVGDLFIRNTNTDKDIVLTSDDGSGGNADYIRCDGSNGEVKLYHYGAQKLYTKSDGVDISGELQCDSLDVDGAGDFTGDVTFGGGAAAVNIAANSDIRFNNGSTWTGNTTDPKIQAYNNSLYISGGSSGIIFRENNTNRAIIDGDGHFTPATDDTYDLGTSSVQWRNGYFDGTVNADALDVDGAANITGNVDINGDIRHNGDTNCLFGFPANDTFRISTGGTERFRITSTGAIAIEGSSNYGSSGQVLTSNGNDAPTWQDGGGTVASGCVYENSQTISANYSVTSGKNAMSAGPITIASGVTVTVTSGSTYTIV